MRHLVLAAAALLLLPCLAPPAVADGPLYLVVERTASSTEPLAVTIRSGGGGRVLLRAWRVGNPGALLRAGIRLDRGETLGWLDPRTYGIPAEQEALRRDAGLRPALVGTPIPLAANQPHALDLRLGEPGLYVLAATVGEQTAYATGLVSDLGLVVKRWEGRLLAWAVHRETGAPWSGATIATTLASGAAIEGTTDASGLCGFGRSIPTTARVVASSEGHLAFGLASSHARAPGDRRLYLHAHQPAYRPGERVEVRGILRAVDAGRLHLDPASTVDVHLASPDGSTTDRTTVEVSASTGTFAAGWDLPDDAPTGAWKIVAVVEGRPYAAPLVVDAYRKPAFEVSVRGASPRALVGSSSAFRVEASFYEGGAVAGGKVNWQLLYQRVDRELFPEDELVRLFFGTEREAYRPETLGTGEGILDASGGLDVPVEIPADRADGYLTLRATVFGPDRMAVASSGRIAVAAAPLSVALETDRHLFGPEDTVRISVRVERADGRPAANRAGVLTVGFAPETATAAAREETWLHSLTFRTDARGEASLEAPLAGAGRYAVAVAVPRATDEPAGPPAHAEVHVWAIGERATPGTPGAGLEVIADRDHYAVGDEARLLVRTPGGPRPVLATLEGDGLLERRLLGADGGSFLWSVPLGEAHVPNVFATFTSVDHGRLISTTRVLRVPPRTRLLAVDVRPDAADLDPGATSGLSLTVRRADGSPAAGADVGVAIVDEALFGLHADPGAPIEAFFHPPRRNAVTTSDLLQWTSVGYAVPAAHARPGSPAGGVTADGAAPPPAAAMPMPSPSAQPNADAALGAEDAPAEMEAMEEALERVARRSDESGDDEGTELGFAIPDPEGDEEDEGEGAERQAATVREDFRTAIFWSPSLRADEAGAIRVDEVRYGESLTRWRISAVAVDAETRVGRGRGTVRTTRQVTTRITLPRFLRAGDLVLAPLVLRNLTDAALQAHWELHAASPIDGWRREGDTELAAGGTQVLQQQFHAGHAGDVPFTARVSTSVGGDAERRTLPVLPQGIEKVVGHSLLATRRTDVTTFAVPRDAEAGTITCTIRLEPGFAHAMRNALPYLLEYPYGCTEQTLSRFVPLVAAAEALDALGPAGKGLTKELPAMIEAGLKRLADLRHADGGYGWWEHDATDVGMTALVVRGLSRLLEVQPDHETARRLRDGAADALVALVARHGAGDGETTYASAMLALAQAGRLRPEDLARAASGSWRDAGPLARALLLRAAVAVGRQDVIAALRGILDDEARREGDLVFWSTVAPGTSPEGPTRWQDDEIETTAVVMRALLESGVRPELLDGGARWLLRARQGGDRWRSTRDTGAAVEFFAAYAARAQVSGAGSTVSLSLGEEVLWEGALTFERAAEAIELPAGRLAPGARGELRLACPEGTASAAVALRYFETGPAIRAAESGFRVHRRFYRLEAVETDGVVAWHRTPLAETLPSGALVECEITVESTKPREYVMVTSPHAAGFEPAREVGIEVPDRAPAAEARRDGRDDRTMFFVSRMGAGKAVFRHVLRATHVGNFAALPAQAELMYFPDVRGNSDGDLWQITDAGPTGRGEGRDGR